MLSNACDTEKRTVERACKLGAYMHQENGWKILYVNVDNRITI